MVRPFFVWNLSVLNLIKIGTIHPWDESGILSVMITRYATLAEHERNLLSYHVSALAYSSFSQPPEIYICMILSNTIVPAHCPCFTCSYAWDLPPPRRSCAVSSPHSIRTTRHKNITTALNLVPSYRSNDPAKIKAYRDSMMMESVRTSETSVCNYFTRHYIPEDNSEQLYHCACGNSDSALRTPSRNVLFGVYRLVRILEQVGHSLNILAAVLPRRVETSPVSS
jgi:hypothetical protein